MHCKMKVLKVYFLKLNNISRAILGLNINCCYNRLKDTVR